LNKFFQTQSQFTELILYHLPFSDDTLKMSSLQRCELHLDAFVLDSIDFVFEESWNDITEDITDLILEVFKKFNGDPKTGFRIDGLREMRVLFLEKFKNFNFKEDTINFSQLIDLSLNNCPKVSVFKFNYTMHN
jgi:hypothetical protein